MKKCFIVFDELSGRYGAGAVIAVSRTWTLLTNTVSRPYGSRSTSAHCLCQKMNLTSRMLLMWLAEIDWKTAKRIDKKYLLKPARHGP
ncbi:MAG TPA: hypothetical protein VMW67_04955 [Desulfobacteria bacterium]|nr:hypothetical protein [Desulfobacteria bacterium]